MANEKAAAPKAVLTYGQSADLMVDLPFRGRVKVAGLKYATYVQNEASTVEAHSARYRWAQNFALMPDNEAARIQPMVVMDAAVQNAGADITDEALQIAVEGVINRFL